MELGLSGLASGFDWRSLVDQLADVERAPQQRLLNEQSRIRERNHAYSSVETELNVLRGKVEVLNDIDLFNSRLAGSSDEAVATATASTLAATGTYKIDVSQLATASRLQGTLNAGSRLSPTDDVSGLALSSTPLAVPVSGGRFTVNGEIIEIQTSDTLQDVFDRIGTATGGSVTAAYNSSTDTVNLTSAGEIVLGSAADTSNFLQVAKLYNNGTGAVSSTGALGSVIQNKALEIANFATAITDGGSGEGVFRINGVDIGFDSSTDTVGDVMKRINDSAAGVSASYDSINDRFTLTNEKEGDLGISLEDVSGNFLSATGLSGGALVRGKNLEYSINDGGTLISQSNTISADSSGIQGVAIAVKQTGETTIDVTKDAEKIKSAINAFISAYNKVQSLIDTETASETDAEGKVTAGTLSGEREANEIATRLRSMANSQVSGLDGAMSMLAQVGIHSNGNDNTLALSDGAALDNAIENNLDSLISLFTDEASGVAVRMDAYLERTVGEEGSLISKQKNLTKQSSDIVDQIAVMERIVQANRESMINRFVVMEQAQARSNQQMQYLSQNLGN